MSPGAYSNGVRNNTDRINQYAIRELYSRIDMENTHRYLLIPAESLDAPESIPAGSVMRCDTLNIGSFTCLTNIYRKG